VVDMDWHLVHSVEPEYGSGWTGYTWNRELFPDPEAFLADVHARGLKVTLNLHPAEGVRAFEDRYADMAQALGYDVGKGEPIEFDLTNRAFLMAYFDVLLHPLEAQGVDFWWIDWQQGRYSRLRGVDPLWLLNHYHFLDAARKGRRPLILSRYAGPGSHRYPIGFSGDTVISWASLAFQPEFTATAANIGYGWWSHDIGGHFGGVRDEELTLRWTQLGVFSPILRLHSSPNPFFAREPWAFGPEAEAQLKSSLRFRHRLVPYLHTMNHRAAAQGQPLVRPMYHLHPEDRQAYTVPNQFAFGTEMMVAPITAPQDPVARLGSVRAWLPAGTWTDLFTGVSYDGGGILTLHRDSRSIPVLVRAGGIIPLASEADLDASQNPEHLEVVVAPGADGWFELLEDDGTGGMTAPVPTAATPITWDQAAGILTIGPVRGAVSAVPTRRTWTVTLLGCAGVNPITQDEATLPKSMVRGRTSVTVADVPADQPVRLVFGPNLSTRTDDIPARVFEVLHRAAYDHEAKQAAWHTVLEPIDGAVKLARLQALGLPPALLSAVTELIVARQ
jgi:alpha-glucosidase (family GH31 glycosyl hydrolase)